MRVAPQGLIQYLGHVARRRREEGDLLIAEICARLRHDSGIKKTDGALSRFERGETTPTYLDEVITAYAAETGDDAIDYWTEALEAFAAASDDRARARAADAVEREAREAAQQRGAGRAAPARGSSAARKRRAGG